MTTNRVLRTVWIAALSMFLVLAACSFLTIGSVSAQAASSSTTVTVQIVDNSQGQAVFSPSAITIKSGAQVSIVNHTAVTHFVFNTLVFLRVAPGASVPLVPQISPERFKIYDSTPSSLLITISPGP